MKKIVSRLASIPGSPGRMRPASGCARVARPVAPRLLRLLTATAAVLLGAALAGGMKSSRSGPTMLPLVSVDEELQSFLDKAREYIKQQDYERAIEILQAMITRPDCGFAPSQDQGRFVAVRVLASSVLGGMPPEGLKKYRQLYDARALGLYRRALADGDAAGLRAVADRYEHTTSGRKALEALGAISFDRGQFAQAAHFWQRSLETAEPPQKPLLMAKSACALYLSGQRGRADALAQSLRKDYPDAQAALGGRQQRLDEFLARLAEAPVAAGAGNADVRSGWPGLGGMADGAGVMTGCAADLVPSWRQPEDQPLVAGKAALDAVKTSTFYDSRRGQPIGCKTSSGLREGHVEVRIAGDSLSAQFRMPAMLSPVTMGDLLIYRDDYDVIARDGLTGEIAWSTRLDSKHPGKPLERIVVSRSGGNSSNQFRFGETGRYWLTTDGRNVYALYDFPRTLGNPNCAAAIARNNPSYARAMANTSRLMSLSGASGKLNWEIGNGLGDSDFISGCRFVSAPTFHDGRLYVTAIAMEHFYLLCLDARNGSLIWHSAVCQLPPSRSYGYYYLDSEERGSPPAVADGKAFVVTNSGVIGAFDAQSGQAVWAYQYGGPYPSLLGVSKSQSGGISHMELFPPNPMIAAKGRLVCLPSDSQQMLVLGAEDGKVLNSVARADQRHLSYIDDDRVLLSGEGMMVYSLGKGQWAFTAPDKDLSGRPAVMSRTVLASGSGRIVSLDLESYEITYRPLSCPDGLLGNLVTNNGMLFAANAAGVCGYGTFDQAAAGLGARIEAAEGSQRMHRKLERAIFAFNAGRYELAGEDLRDVCQWAQQAGNVAMQERVKSWQYRLHVALGNAAGAGATMVEMFRKAQALAGSEQDQAHMLLRLAKCREQIGDLEQAIQAASELAEAYGEQKLVDVAIGPAANPPVRFADDAPRRSGRELAEDLIRRIVATHPDGRKAYRAVDAAAKAALDEARIAQDASAMERVARRWPVSIWADGALMLAAETRFIKAASVEREAAEAEFDQAEALLAELAQMSQSPLNVSARAGLAYLHKVRGRAALAALAARSLRGADGSQEVIFADMRGRLQDVVGQLASGAPTSATSPALPALPAGPMKETLSLKDEVRVVVGQAGKPVWIDGGLLALCGGKAVLLDVGQASAESAVKWSAVMPPIVSVPSNFRVPWQSVVGGLTKDGSTIVLAEALGGLGGFDRQTGAVKWQKTMRDLGAISVRSMAVGSGEVLVLDVSGMLACVDMKDGDVRWRSPVATERSGTGSVVVVGGMAIVSEGAAAFGAFGGGTGRSVTMLDLSNGKILRRWASATRIDWALAGEGTIIVRLIGNELSAYEVCALGGMRSNAVWTRELPYPSPRLLACGYDRAALASEGKVIVVSLLACGGTLGTADLSAGSGKGRDLFAGDFVGDDLYAMFSQNASRANRGRAMPADGLGIAKISLSGRPQVAWSVDLLPPTGRPSAVWPMAAGANVLCVSAYQVETNPPRLWLLDMTSGSICAEMALPTSTDSQVQACFIYRGPGLIPSDSKLVIETVEGLAVYGAATEAGDEKAN